MKVLITGINGQLGWYAQQLWASQGYEVVGTTRTSSTRMSGDNRELDILDSSAVSALVRETSPDYLIHYAAQSMVGTSFAQPSLTMGANVDGSLNILEALRTHSPGTRSVFLATSEMFGREYTHSDGNVRYQNELTPMIPVSPYGVSKLAMYHLVRIYRESYGLPVYSAIQFNSESPRRGAYFVTRKITSWLGKYKANSGKCERLPLGNVDGVYRDWSHALDSVRAHYLMAVYGDTDYVVGSGETHSLSEFLERAFKHAGVDDVYSHFYQDERFMRPNELFYLASDPSKIKRELGWEPQISFDDLIKEMVENDVQLFSKNV